jgi:hypothetical protein
LFTVKLSSLTVKPSLGRDAAPLAIFAGMWARLDSCQLIVPDGWPSYDRDEPPPSGRRFEDCL